MGGGSGAAVQLPLINVGNDGTSSPVYSGLRFDSDGNIYRMSATGTWQAEATWLLEGAASTYYLFRTVNTGSLTNDDGDGNQLSTDDLDFWISNSVTWFERTCAVTFSISDDTLGSNVIATRQYNFSAELIGSGTPP